MAIKAVVLSAHRSGSTFFFRCLYSHPDLDTPFDNDEKRSGEIFTLSSKRLDRRRKFLDRNCCESQNVIYKLMYNQCDKLKFINRLKKLPVIHVMRRDPVRKVLSDLVSNIEVEFGGRGKGEKFIPIDTFMGYVDVYLKKMDFYRDTLNNFDYTEVYMEDFVGRMYKSKDRVKTYMKADVNRRVCDFMEIPFFKMYSDTEKLTKRDHWSYITNATEIKKAIKGKYKPRRG